MEKKNDHPAFRYRAAHEPGRRPWRYRLSRRYRGQQHGRRKRDETDAEVLSIIDGHLAKAGSDKSRLLSATIYLTDMTTFGEMNAVWDAWVSPGNTPARATVEVKLAAPRYNVEIMVTAGR
jgi:enamine deaminase RidA (YjgF/YER057c/UK114 family)